MGVCAQTQPCVLYLHSEVVKVDNNSKLHSESDTQGLKGCGRFLASDMCVFSFAVYK